MSDDELEVLRKRVAGLEILLVDKTNAALQHEEHAQELDAELSTLRDDLVQWRDDVEKACLDHGFSITDKIDELLKGVRK